MRKPQRTFGLSLAIGLTVLLFTCAPLTQFTFVSMLDQRLQPTYDANAPFAAGGDVRAVDRTRLYAQTAAGVLFLGIAALAWRGKPARIRYVMIGAVLALTTFNAALALGTLNTPQTARTGIDSGDALNRTLLLTQLCFTVVIPLYAVWYMSRAPARAFYRGYYLTRPEDSQSGDG